MDLIQLEMSGTIDYRTCFFVFLQQVLGFIHEVKTLFQHCSLPE